MTFINLVELMSKNFRVMSIVMLAMTMLLAACSSTPDYRGVYENKTDDRPLEVPPDLTQPNAQTGLNLPQLASQQGDLKISGGKVAPLQYGKARLVRESSLRWLEVAKPIDEVWGAALYFFRGMGFKITKDDQSLGIIETDWLENRADVPTNWLASLFKRLYDAGLQDRYRLRLERSSDEKHTLVFIAHRGLKEVYGEEEQGLARTKGWQAREPDAELESEMLQRFAIYLGGAKADLQQQVAQVNQQAEFATITMQDGIVALKMDEGFARGWRRVGLALDRMGVLIEDRNRSKGIYFVKLSEEFFKDEEGLFSKLFSSKEEITQLQYILRLIEKDQQTLVAVFDRKGQSVSSNVADRILKQLKSHLN